MGCCGGKAVNIKRTIMEKHKEKEDSITNGIPIKEANIGHYYADNELGNPPLSIIKQWNVICQCDTQKHITNMNEIEKIIQSYYKEKKVQIVKLVEQGVPSRIRWTVWKILLNYKLYYKAEDYQLFKLKESTYETKDQIEKDALRTFSSHIFYSKSNYSDVGRNSIQNVLRAYAIANPNTQYCQGMNFFVGFLLLLSENNEEEVFWVFSILLKMPILRSPDIEFEGFFVNGFPALEPSMKEFDRLAQRYIPRLKGHLDELNYSNILWVHKWVMTLLLYSFPQSFCIRIWDSLMAFGVCFVFNIIISILVVLEERMLRMDMYEINILLKDKLHMAIKDPNKIIKAAEKIITDRKI